MLARSIHHSCAPFHVKAVSTFAPGALAAVFLLAACATAPGAQGAKDTANAAPDREAILATVDAFFLGMAAKDGDAIAAVVAPGATMVAIGYGETGASPPRRGPIQDFIDAIKSGKGAAGAREAYWSPTVMQRADLAVVWTPYRIDRGGKRIHCGIDVFNLARDEGRWLIDSASFTMEPKSCPELEPVGVVARPIFPQ